MIDQGIHAAQQMLMGDRLHLNARHGHRVEPTQDTELGFRIAQAIEHHHPNQRFDIDAVPGLAEHAAQFAKAQGLPQFVQSPHVAQCSGRFELDRRQRCIQEVWPTRHLEQARNDGIETVRQLIQTPERDQGAMPGLARLVTKGLDKLEILAGTGARDLEEHASTLTALDSLSNMASGIANVPLHYFL